MFQRLALGALTLFVVSLFIFFSVEMLPGDVAQAVLGQNATPETLAALRREMGLDHPPVTRYLGWFGGIVQGDLGQSIVSGRDIAGLLGERLANTLFLALFAAVIAVPLAIGLGLAAALYRNTLFDRTTSTLALMAISLPEFFVAYLLVWGFEMACLKGASQRRVILKHTLPNAVAPIVTVVALNLAYLITGVVIVEVVFVYPGMGQLLVDSVAKRDFTVVQATCLIFSGAFILLNLIADMISIASDPRLMHKN